MKIYINDKDKIETLDLIDPKNGVNWVEDFIEARARIEFNYDEDREMWSCKQEDFEWWLDVINQRQELDIKIAKLQEEFGNDLVNSVVEEAFRANPELEYESIIVSTALDTVFGV